MVDDAPIEDRDAEPSQRPSRMAALAGWRGCVVAVAISTWVLFALWLIANGSPSSVGEPFRFTPPPDASPTATITVQPGTTPAASDGS